MILITGSSASGKTEIAYLLEKYYGFSRIVTCTTRPKRVHEIDGVDYHFLSADEFLKKLNNNEFIETTKYNNYYYGSLKKDLKPNSVVVLTPEGINAIYRLNKEKVTIFYLSTPETIRRERMIGRKDMFEDIDYRLRIDDEIFNESQLSHIDYIIDTSEKSPIELAQEIYQLIKNS